jgi:DNA helicase II / ATP-dependent DNA helicase PcrA
MTHRESVEATACAVCGKPQGLLPNKCHSTIGKRNPLCNAHKYCRIDEKSDDQLDYVLSPIDQNIFLKACPGSGKTEVVGLKAAYEIRRWNKNVGGIAVLTFTNTAADIIRERVDQFAGADKAGYPHFIETFDSWLHNYVAHPYGYLLTGYKGRENGDRSFRIIDSHSRSVFLENSSFRTIPYRDKGFVKANEYYLDREISKYVFIDKHKGLLDFADKKELARVKKNFAEKGFAVYQDIENICFALLSKEERLTNRLALRFPLILVDECQDLSWIQLQILDKFKNAGSVIHFIGDLDQAIFEFKQVDPKKVVGFTLRNDFKEMLLKDNFRSSQAIVDLCQNIVKNPTPTSGKGDQKVICPCIYTTYTTRTLSEIPAWFEDLLKQKGLAKNNSAIVARGWATIGKLRPSGSNEVNNYQKRLAMAIYLWRVRQPQALNDSLKYLGHFMAEKYFQHDHVNAKNHNCPDRIVSAISWRIYLAYILDTITGTEWCNLDQTWDVWAKSIREHFHQIASECLLCLSNTWVPGRDLDKLTKLTGATFKALPESQEIRVIDTICTQPPSVASSTMRITTIHNIKGETLDAIMLVSAADKRGGGDGYWENWLESPSEEAARLAYVASSRPRHLLVWAIPEDKKGDYLKLERLGFVRYSD